MTTVLNNVTIVVFFNKVTNISVVALETVVHGHNDYQHYHWFSGYYVFIGY